MPEEALAKVETESRNSPKVPVPQGYNLLIALPEVNEKSEGGILLVQETVTSQTVNSIVGFVAAMGPDAYKDPTKFPTGPWCKVGDAILMQAYSGTRFKIDGVEFRLMNDTSVQAVVEDPTGIEKA
jgi:co-chaperonin GroES (HSP10)